MDAKESAAQGCPDEAHNKADINCITRVLKRGDLARINSKKQGKFKDHSGDLGRIVRVAPVGPTMENSHPFVYDFELVLGGKLSGIFRADLQYTTASQEGMTGESRARRKRKDNTSLEAEINDEPKKSKGQGGRKKKPPAKKGKGPSTAKTSTSKPANKKRPTGDKPNGSSKKSKSNPSKDNFSTLSVTTSQAMDMYKRHRREFERSVSRLEKTDVYNFFGTDVPPEYQELYTKEQSSLGAVQVDIQTAQSANSIHKMQLSNSTSRLVDPPTLSAPQSPSEQDGNTISQRQSPSVEEPKNGGNATNHNANHDNSGMIRRPIRPAYNFLIISERIKHGRYIVDRIRLENEERIDFLTPYFKSIGRNNMKRPKQSAIPVLHPKGVNWDLFRQDVIAMCDTALTRNPDVSDFGAGTLTHTVGKIKDLLEQIYEKNGRRHNVEIAAANDRHRFSLAMDKTNNLEAAMQGKWKRDAFSERRYERLKEDAVCAGLSELDERIATYELRTTIKDSFVGLAYTYDDTGQSEGWMKSVLDEAGEKSEREEAALALASDDGVIKAQVAASMQTLLIAVQDKVMTETGVLEQQELRSANWEVTSKEAPEPDISTSGAGSASGPEIVEQPVWGMDCYTRRNISICLETEFDPDTVLTFVEKWLLPAINACPANLAYDISNAARILEGLPFDRATSLEDDNGATHEEWKVTLLGKAVLNKIATSGPSWLPAAAQMLRRARDTLGPDFFRVHPKGHGSIVLCEKLEPNRLVTFYRGEVYPSWRWGEKIDAISMIQEKKGLKPVLPDFFNMAMERPQSDPRGYGLLFVDASRKSGYGSMLSHSCQPSCEVRVVAVNGELRLAMTTLREMTIGDELTFDYNAVTESLIEFQSAVCLCGHGQCRGSFLHFATADCYQQVLNRNSPIAVRFANLIKGCTKQKMSEDDDRILKRHGFQTAAFGAISVNRRKASVVDMMKSNLDSMDIVPVWLRTYVADALRYIEYERRALPIALLCNDLFDDPGDKKAHAELSQAEEPKPNINEADHEEDEKPIKGAKPEPTFFFYSRTQREHFLSLLVDDDQKNKMIGIELKREIQKIASVHWKLLDPEAKEIWKAKAATEWEKNGGKLKAKLEEQRTKRLSKPKKSAKSGKKDSKNGKSIPESKQNSTSGKNDPVLSKPKISFQQADGQGVSAMEQRIQQLTQTLSRVGRVLDRHREAALCSSSSPSLTGYNSDASLLEVAHSPLVIMPDEHVVAWMWNHDDGIVKMLLRHSEGEICVSPELRQSLLDTVSKHTILQGFERPWEATVPVEALPMSPTAGRKQLNEALLQLRKNLLDGIQQMASMIKKHKATSRKKAARKKKEQEDNAKKKEEVLGDPIRCVVHDVMEGLVAAVEALDAGNEPISNNTGRSPTDLLQNTEGNRPLAEPVDQDQELDPWLQNFNKRFKIEKAADLLLMYTKTGNFFSIKPYETLKSSPIEVYARELSNSVPLSAIDMPASPEPVSTANSPQRSLGQNGFDEDDMKAMEIDGGSKVSKKSKKRLCDPEDIVSHVSVEYQGDYVLSQLLQWYNAGIGQKPGLPDGLGCILLPSMDGCWKVDGTSVSNSITERATRYQSTQRRRLIDWFKDPLKRGSPWPDDVRRAFVDKDEDNSISDAASVWLPLGSPILDLLVTGDDYNMNSTIDTLSSFHSSNSARNGDSVADGLLSSVDEGRPAQAVSNWVQCESPACQKWRKVPWNVDIDMLSEQFFCKDNVWNPQSASCDAPEDDWDETTDARVGADGSAIAVEPTLDTSKVIGTDVDLPCKLADFKLGARFDIHRPERKSWSVGTVVKLDLTGVVKRVQIHYPRMQVKHDEWIEIDSLRFAPLLSKVTCPKRKENSTKSKDTATKTKSKKKNPASNSNGSDSGSRPIEISDDASADQVVKASNIRPDDSSMADVFIQDSDDNSSANDQSQSDQSAESEDDLANSEGSQLSAHIDEVLKDSDDEATVPAKVHCSTITDDSSPDTMDARNKAQKVEGSASSWTIPKKKISPNTECLLSTDRRSDQIPPKSELLQLGSGNTSQESTKGTLRIPRKKACYAEGISSSLLERLGPKDSSQQDKELIASRKDLPRPSTTHFKAENGSPLSKGRDSTRIQKTRRKSGQDRHDIHNESTHGGNNQKGFDRRHQPFPRESEDGENRKFRDQTSHRAQASPSNHSALPIERSHDSRRNRSRDRFGHERLDRDEYSIRRRSYSGSDGRRHRDDYSEAPRYDRLRYDRDLYIDGDHENPSWIGYNRGARGECTGETYDHYNDSRGHQRGIRDEFDGYRYADDYPGDTSRQRSLYEDDSRDVSPRKVLDRRRYDDDPRPVGDYSDGDRYTYDRTPQRYSERGEDEHRRRYDQSSDDYDRKGYGDEHTGRYDGRGIDYDDNRRGHVRDADDYANPKRSRERQEDETANDYSYDRSGRRQHESPRRQQRKHSLGRDSLRDTERTHVDTRRQMENGRPPRNSPCGPEGHKQPRAGGYSGGSPPRGSVKGSPRSLGSPYHNRR